MKLEFLVQYKNSSLITTSLPFSGRTLDWDQAPSVFSKNIRSSQITGTPPSVKNFGSSQIIADHRKSTQIIADHRRSTQIIANQRRSSQIIGTPPSVKNFGIIADHRKSTQIIADHRRRCLTGISGSDKPLIPFGNKFPKSTPRGLTFR